ncbi:MAG: DUF2190 family protein [Thermoguttaceae bacterium]|nr:DUF2190 family protein [Thermoguttaceae bacterium]
MAIVKQAWASIDYTAGADIAAGGVVSIGANVAGVASYPIANGATGGIVVKGVVECAKASGGIDLGAALYWDATNSKATTTAGENGYLGVAAKAAQSGDATVFVLLNEGFVDTTGSSSS